MFVGWVKTDMGLAKGQPAKIDVETSTAGILEVVERAAALQLQGKQLESSQKFMFKTPLDQVEKRAHLKEFADQLKKDNFAYVKHNGELMKW
jgi:hypothetical protein